ncbi:MAG: DUF924 family protein [Alphaproteobacteria bacterium]|nr:DUF924 family protein [Alphaproteobacteria bacterium]
MRDSKNDILRFWFEEVKPQQWFQANPAFDADISKRFSGDYELAKSGVYDSWTDGAEGCLALCILLDQFPRSMFRGQARAFESDAKALQVALHALEKHFDKLVPPLRRRFLYLPFEHCEDMAMQERSVALFATMKKDDPLGYDYALRHRDVIARFGRFPHRNEILGRPSTADEAAYLVANGGF